MKILKLGFILVFIFSNIVLSSCKKDKEEEVTPQPTTGFLIGTVSEYGNSSMRIEGARIIVYNSATDAPAGKTANTDTEGKFNIELTPGNYYLKLGKQGYDNNPATGIAPISVNIRAGSNTESNYKMQKSSIEDGGYITGKITDGSNAAPGVLVVASDGSEAFSSVTDSDGKYYIYNVPEGSYSLQPYIGGYNSSPLSVSVASSTETTAETIALNSGATGKVSGTVTFLATDNGEVDVTLTHLLTKESIPGLATHTVSGNYIISGVPDGTFIARASFMNDSYVVDPDWIVKNGEPQVKISGNNVERNFSVTGAVTIISPSNQSTAARATEISSTQPEFSWQAYSSASDYIIEVTDINGNVIWGGFTVEGTTITKNISIPKSATSIKFNSDNKANEELTAGNIYRWRVYASKDDAKDPNGWILISVSEEQKGLFMIK